MNHKDVLRTWYATNNFLRVSDEKGTEELLEAEFAGRNRLTFTMRIQQRLNSLRATRAMNEVIARTHSKPCNLKRTGD